MCNDKHWEIATEGFNKVFSTLHAFPYYKILAL